MAALSPRVIELKFRIVNADLTPAQNAAIERLIESAMEKHIEACDE
jgi:hypothetical protein